MARFRPTERLSPKAVSLALLFTAAAAVLMQAVLWNPLAVVVPIMLALCFVGARHPERASLVCLLAGPILLSTITVGPLTADNLVTVAGLAFALLASVVRGSIPFTTLSALPIAMGIAVCVSLIYNDLAFGADILRFAALAVVPFVAGSDEVSARYFRRITLGVMLIGGLSILMQPLVGFPAPYQDTETSLLRNGGLFGHPNFAAYCLGIGLLVIVLQNRIGVRDVAIALALTAPLLLSGARTASAVTALVAFFFLLTRVKRLIATLSAGFILLLGVGNALTSRLQSIGSDGVGSSDAFVWRLAQWQQAFELLDDHVAWGVGRNQIQNILPNGLGAHSGYVTLVVETGLAGSMIIAIGFAFALMSLAGKRPQGAAAIWVFALLVSVTDPVLLYPSTLTMLIVLSTRSIQVDTGDSESAVNCDATESTAMTNPRRRRQVA